jgi:hypothetical protein
MTSDGGGWTRVVGISPSNVNHSNTAAVTWSNGDPTSYGKLSDATINAIKSTTSSTAPVIRLKIGGVAKAFFPGSCVFNGSTANATGDCLKFSETFSAPTWLYGHNNDGCGIPTYYATLATYLAGDCQGESNPNYYMIYRRKDWRGTSYDAGAVTLSTDYSGEVSIR